MQAFNHGIDAITQPLSILILAKRRFHIFTDDARECRIRQCALNPVTGKDENLAISVGEHDQKPVVLGSRTELPARGDGQSIIKDIELTGTWHHHHADLYQICGMKLTNALIQHLLIGRI